MLLFLTKPFCRRISLICTVIINFVFIVCDFKLFAVFRFCLSRPLSTSILWWWPWGRLWIVGRQWTSSIIGRRTRLWRWRRRWPRRTSSRRTCRLLCMLIVILFHFLQPPPLIIITLTVLFANIAIGSTQIRFQIRRQWLPHRWCKVAAWDSRRWHGERSVLVGGGRWIDSYRWLYCR